MNVEDVVTAAESLTEYLNENVLEDDAPLQVADLLDAAASVGVTLVPDLTDSAGAAYLEVLREGAGG